MSITALLVLPFSWLLPKEEDRVRASRPQPPAAPAPARDATVYGISLEQVVRCKRNGWPLQRAGGSCAGCGNSSFDDLKLRPIDRFHPDLLTGSCAPLCEGCRPKFF